jgi:hypothetical protein
MLVVNAVKGDGHYGAIPRMASDVPFRRYDQFPSARFG